MVPGTILGIWEISVIPCMFALGGMNFKNGVISVCPRQSNQLVFQHETYLPSEIFNHKNFRWLRKKLYSDEWPAGCDTCEDMEKNGLSSMRYDYPLNEDNVFCKREPGIDPESAPIKLMDCYDVETHSVTFEGLRHFEYRFSTACNFSCLHCSKVYSSGWVKKLKKYEPDQEVIDYDIRQLLGAEHRHGPNDDNEMRLTTKQALEITEDLIENFPYIEYIDFSGGELLWQKQFFPVLQKLAEHPNHKKINISFHTNFNANFDVAKLSELLQPFRQSSICISIDAGKTFYDYFRNGGKWDKLKENINEFKKLNVINTDRSKIFVDISCTTSIYQMFDIYDVFDSFFELGCHFDASIVQSPKYLDPSLIMYDFKEETLQDLKLTEDMVEKRITATMDYEEKKIALTAKFWLDYITKYVKQTRVNYPAFNRWLIYRRKSDELWGNDFNDYFQNYKIIDDELVRVK
mgnify:CR=1 FL=1